MDGQVNEPALAELFAAIARAFEAEPTPRATLERITRTAVHTVPGCDHAAVSVVRSSGEIETQASTGEVPRLVDALQYELDQGPCLAAIRERDSHLITDLVHDRRWPELSARALGIAGVRGILSFRLFVRDDVIGALNLYSSQPDGFDDTSHAVGAILAAHAALAVNSARDRAAAENLQVALTSSREIGMAVGILMARGPRSEAEAFNLLRLSSQRLNLKLREIATQVVETGELDEEGIRCHRT